jgi:hypothetical protein
MGTQRTKESDYSAAVDQADRSSLDADRVAKLVAELRAQRERDQRYREMVRRYRAGGRAPRGQQ